MELNKTALGYEIKTPRITMLLGGVHSQLPQLVSAYPQFQFARVKQTHSDLVIHTHDASSDYQINADAHYTEASNLALCVVTADCVPVLIYDPATSFIAAIHAGWRGVASRIIPKTIAELIKHGSNPANMNVIIGPHIQKTSFEVGSDVRDQILNSLDSQSSEEHASYFEEINQEKSLVDLNLVVRSQLQHCGVVFENLFSLHIDTVTSPEFHSYRRDKEKSGRQISFICRTV